MRFARRYAGIRTVSGMTPLHYAAANGHAAVASFLLRSGADLLATNLVCKGMSTGAGGLLSTVAEG